MKRQQQRRNTTLFLRSVFLVALWTACATGLAATEFELEDVDGQTYRLSDYRGQWVVVNFWATWCPPCLEEIPDLIKFHDSHKDTDAVVLGINFGEELSDGELQRFTQQLNINYPILKASPTIEKEVGPIEGMPTSYLVDPAGELAAWIEGRVTARQIEDFIRDAKDAE
jgi:peroxiredoxin